MNSINTIFGETPLFFDHKELYDLSIEQQLQAIDRILLQYPEEYGLIKDSLSVDQFDALMALCNSTNLYPPFIYISSQNILKLVKFTQNITEIEKTLGELISLGVINTGIAEEVYNEQHEKVSLSSVGYRSMDPLLGIFLYKQANKILPHWLKSYLSKDIEANDFDTYEQELISRLPESGYIMSPTSRKLTCDRDKWFWLTSERNPNNGDLEQVMYMLDDRMAAAAVRLKERNIIKIHSHHYGKPIFIANEEMF